MNEPDDSDEPLTIDDIRGMWMIPCFGFGLIGLVGFAVRYAIYSENPPSSEPTSWGLGILLLWIIFFLQLVLFGLFAGMAAMHLRMYAVSMRATDKVGLLLLIVGLAMISWNFLFMQIYPASGLGVQRFVSGAVLTTAGCLFLYGKTRSK